MIDNPKQVYAGVASNQPSSGGDDDENEDDYPITEYPNQGGEGNENENENEDNIDEDEDDDLPSFSGVRHIVYESRIQIPSCGHIE